MKTLIKNGYVLDPATKRDGRYDILIDGNIIAEVAETVTTPADVVIDAKDRYVMPGFIDLHVHLREPGYEYKETIMTGSMAAAKGGFTSICPMPNTNPTIDNNSMVEYLLLKAQREAVVNIVPVGAVTKGQEGKEVSDVIGMVEAGARAISEDGKSVVDTFVYREAMKLAKRAGIPVFAHCEDKSLAGNGVLNEGSKARELELEGISNTVEDVIVARDILMAEETGVRLHLCHCSTKGSVAMVKLAKGNGIAVTAEVCPHHFAMTEDEIPEDDANYKMNPPLRSSADVQALKEGLRDNVIDVIATDHAPHSAEEKEKSISEAPFGIVGLETAFALTITELVEKGYLTPMQMVEKLSYNPAMIIHSNRGSLEVGRVADLVIADPVFEYEIDVNQFVSKGRNSPFHGKKVRGRIEKTFVMGQLVYEFEQ